MLHNLECSKSIVMRGLPVETSAMFWVKIEAKGGEGAGTWKCCKSGVNNTSSRRASAENTDGKEVHKERVVDRTQRRSGGVDSAASLIAGAHHLL